MKRRLKKSLAFFLAVTLLVGLLPTGVLAAEKTKPTGQENPVYLSTNRVTEQTETVVSDAQKLQEVKKLINNSFYKMKPVCGKDSNVVDVFNEYLASKGYGDVKSTIISTDNTDYVQEDGTIQYIKTTLPAYVHQKNVSIGFEISCGNEKLELSSITAMIGWDTEYYSENMHAEAEKLNGDKIKGNNKSIDEVTEDLSLPQIMGSGANSSWSTISWESSNTDAINIKQGDDWGYITVPRIGVVTRTEEDQEVTLTATLKPTESNINTSIDNIESFTKEIKVVIKGTGVSQDALIAAKKAEMQALMDESLTPDIFTDFNTGEPIDINNVYGDFKWKTYSRLNKQFVYKEFSVTSDSDVVKVNGVRTNVDIFGKEDKTVNLTFTWTKNYEGVNVVATKTFPITVRMIDEEELDKEVMLMEAVKEHYFDGLNDRRYKNADSVTGDLHSFKEASFDENGNLKFAYNINDKTGKGIVPTDIDPTDTMGTSGFNLFKSSNTAIMSHENLLVTRPDKDEKVTISSVLTSERFGVFAVAHPENAKLQKIYRQNVSTEVTVVGTANDEPDVEPVTIGTTISAQAENTFLCPYTNIDVTSGLAKAYGYSYAAGIKKNQVTTLDVLVAVHQAMFGDSFTKETAKEFLEVSSTGTISKVFGIDTMAIGFTVNGVCPHDGVINPDYGTYTGYTINQAIVNDADEVEFLMYQDTSMCMDYYTYFTQTNTRIKTITVKAGESINLVLKGYMLAWGGFYDEEYKMGVEPVEDAQLVIVDQYGNTKEIPGALTDEDGNVTIKFAEAGEYRVSAIGKSSYVDIFMPKLTVTVEAEEIDIEALKNAAKNEIKSYVNLEDYRTAEKDTITRYIGAGCESIDYSSSEAEINLVLELFKGLIDKEKTNAQYEAEEKEAADKAEAAKVDEAINTLPAEITLENESAVKAARAAFENLTEVQKAFVSEDAVAKLVAAEKSIDKIRLLTKVNEAKEEIVLFLDKTLYRDEQVLEINAIITKANLALDEVKTADEIPAIVASTKELLNAVKTDAELKKEEKIAADKKAAKEVTDAIEAIGEVTLNSEIAVGMARAAYEALTVDQKDYVSNETVALLVSAEEKLAELKAAKALQDAKIKAIEEVTVYTEGKVYREVEAEALKGIIDKATEDINTVRAIEDIDDIIKSAKEAMDKLKTDAEYTQDERAIAIEELKSYVKLSDYREAEAAEIVAIMDLAIENLEKAESKNFVSIVEYTKQLIDEIKTDAKLTEEENEKAASAVTVMINEIGEVTIDSEDVIKAARTAYENLNDVQKELVSEVTLKKLAEAESTFTEIKAESDARMAAVGQKYDEVVEGLGTVEGVSDEFISDVKDIFMKWFR